MCFVLVFFIIFVAYLLATEHNENNSILLPTIGFSSFLPNEAESDY